MAVEVDITYEGDLHCSATHAPSGQVLTTDAPLDNGGRGAAFSPTDLVGTALGTCIVTIMGLIATRHELDISGTRVNVVKEMVADPRRRIGSLTVTVVIPNGGPLSPENRQRLERAAELCPVKQSLDPRVDVKIDFVYEG